MRITQKKKGSEEKHTLRELDCELPCISQFVTSGQIATQQPPAATSRMAIEGLPCKGIINAVVTVAVQTNHNRSPIPNCLWRDGINMVCFRSVEYFRLRTP